MPLLALRDGRGMVQWEPTTDLICSGCRAPLEICPKALETVNFMFDLKDYEALERGKYWYLHKPCTRIEDLLVVQWGWHPMGLVLGTDRFLKDTWGNLARHLKKHMAPGVYDTLYAQWLPAMKPARPRVDTPPMVEARPKPERKAFERLLALRFRILKRDNYRCRLCGISARDGEQVRLEVDHITPRSKGGTDDPSNLWTLCFACNRGKGVQSL